MFMYQISQVWVKVNEPNATILMLDNVLGLTGFVQNCEIFRSIMLTIQLFLEIDFNGRGNDHSNFQKYNGLFFFHIANIRHL